ncbi:AAA family ATPase [Halieaceae bacterium]|nr:AAA family ATPase [Halieaceae bacterium]
MNDLTHRQRLPAEMVFADELARLAEVDTAPRPPGWLLSPLAVEKFVLGDAELELEQKFVAPRELVTRVVISLATQRGAMLVGEPGTAKSWLSELLAAAICGDSTLVVQGGAIETVQQLVYSWNQTLLEKHGPCPEALIPGPVYRAMQDGKLVRFEEIARTAPALQDALLSLLSERAASVPELPPEESTLFARDGFNIIGTSNTSDQGVNVMSAALKRRMNFETIRPISAVEDEIGVVMRESARLLRAAGVEVAPDLAIISALTTIFHELRNGQTLDGRSTDRLAGAVMSTAEAVAVAHAMGVYAYYYRDGAMAAQDLTDFLIGAAVKDTLPDLKRLNHYFETEITRKDGDIWRQIHADWQRIYRG